MTRRELERKYASLKVTIVDAIPRRHEQRWSVEIPTGCLGEARDLLHAETIIEDYIEREREYAENERQHEEQV